MWFMEGFINTTYLKAPCVAGVLQLRADSSEGAPGPPGGAASPAERRLETVSLAARRLGVRARPTEPLAHEHAPPARSQPQAV